jgi:hypothetical protein
METSLVQSIKLAIITHTGLSKDALHVYVGLSIYLLVALFVKKSMRSLLPVAAVAAVACAGEVVDMIDDIRSLGYWRWGASVHDIGNTLVWPVVLFLLARYTRLIGSRGSYGA